MSVRDTLMHKDDMPLRPMMEARAFAKWGIDFVGPIDPNESKLMLNTL